MIAAEHVSCLADLVEHLVGGDPQEVGVHELDDRPHPPVHGHSQCRAGETVLADRCPQDPVWEAPRQTLGGTVRPPVEPVDVFAQDDDALVGLHTAIEHCSDGVDEPGVRELARERRLFDGDGAVQLARVAAQTDVHEACIRPELRADPTCAALAVRIVLDKSADGGVHRLLSLGA